MADKSGGDIPEIMILSDDDENETTTKSTSDEPTPNISDSTVPSESSEKPSEVKIAEKPIQPVEKETPKTASEETAPAATPSREPVVMDIDDDSDLELLEEVPVQKAKATPQASPIKIEGSKIRDLENKSELDVMVTVERVESSPAKTEPPNVVDIASSPPSKKPCDTIEKSKETSEEKSGSDTPISVPKNVEGAIIKDEKPDIKPIKVERTKKKICCNMDCNRTSSQFVEADLLTKNFFEAKNIELVCHVCEPCSRSVSLYRQKCLDMLKMEQPIVNAIQFLPSKEMVVLDDSDDEKEAEDDSKDDEKYSIDFEMLNEIVEDIEKKYKFTEQEDKCCESVQKHKAEVLDTFKELDRSIHECYKMLDDVQEQVYGPWKPQSTVLGEFDCDIHSDAPKRKHAVAMKKVTQVHHKRYTTDASTMPDVIAEEVPDMGLDLQTSARKVNIPPRGPLRNTVVSTGETVYAMKSGLYHEWLKAKVVEISQKNGENSYKVKFLKSTAPMKHLTGKQIAYGEPAAFQFEVGTRVIALFHNSEESGPNKYLFYAGIIAECIKVTNNYRYLIFFDDGCTQYVPHEKVRLIVKRSALIWEDCHPDIKDFIKGYLVMYPERPMVRLNVNQKVKTEWNTRWWLTRVKEVDCSLALVHFEADNRTEWIYRGSQRLAPLYCEMQKKIHQKNNKSAVRLHRGLASSAGRKNHAEIEYPRMLDDDDERQKVSRAVAKKSTVSRPFNNIPSLPERRENYGDTLVQQLGSGKWLKPFLQHQCNPKCVNEKESSFKEGDKLLCNPMLIPLNQGWGRESTTYRNTKMQVFYRGPCGRRIRNMQELMRYLRATKSTLPADLFSFDYVLKIDNTFVVDKPLYSIKDISYGSENVKIPCVNTINHTEYPMYVNYSTLRTPSAKTFINDDRGHLVCCDCTDDCQDKLKCACHKITVEEARVLDPKQDPLKVGYNYRRLTLQGQQTTAIYECNKYCKCNSTCLNRVVQQKMKFQLQLFKTEKRGWGLRALHDIPAGSFLCIYAGQIMTEQEGNDEGKQFGDEYLAELDYIEVLERCKEGYESDVTDIEDADYDEAKANEEESDDSNDAELPGQTSEDKDFMSSLGKVKISEEEDKRMTLRKRDEKDNKEKNREETTDEMEDESGMHKGEVKAPKGFKSDKDVSIRYHFDHNDDIFVMDAKSVGNLGRYFNHSCDPNVIVQNVFVDTHDLRFPWVAFFTKRHVPAGTELCWDYNYEIGSLPDRRLDCYCESYNCRGRLL